MKAFFLRRPKLGRTSCKEIRKFSKNIVKGRRNDYLLPRGYEDLWCIRWGTTSVIPNRNVLNSVGAVHEVADKKGFRLKLAEAGLAGKTWGAVEDYFKTVGPPLFINVVVRPAVHAQGKHTYLCKNHKELEDATNRFNDYYISEFFDKVAEYRVFILQGRVVWVAKKTPGNPEDVAWNVARGGRFDNVAWADWPLKAVKKSIEAFNLTKLDFGGVDVMIDKKGDCFVLEINSAPSQTSPYRQECCAKAFDYLLEKESKERIPVIDQKGGYLKFIHPALDNKAY